MQEVTCSGISTATTTRVCRRPDSFFVTGDRDRGVTMRSMQLWTAQRGSRSCIGRLYETGALIG